MMKPSSLTAYLVCLFTALTLNVATADTEVSGHIKLQASHHEFQSDDISSILEGTKLFGGELDARANLLTEKNNFIFESSAELLGAFGKEQEVRRAIDAQTGFTSVSRNSTPDDETRIMDLSAEVIDNQDGYVVSRFDRLYAGYQSEREAIKIGRQALSWGNGITFHALDRFNPFSPLDIDKDYKTGDDMLYGHYLFSNQQEVQFVSVGRRDRQSRSVEADESSFASKYRGTWNEGKLETDFVLASHYGETLLGSGFSIEVLDAIFRTDVSFIDSNDDGGVFTLVSNIDRSYEVFEKNVYLFIEYFYNEVGAKDSYANLTKSLQRQIERGEIYTLGRDYISTGGQIQWNELVSIYPQMIFNLHDESGALQARLEYEMLQNVTLLLGVTQPYGSRNTEFGGISTPQGFLNTGKEYFFRVSFYL